MTYAAIFKEMYFNHKKFIRACLTFCITFSVFAFGSSLYASAGETYTGTEVISVLGNTGGAYLAAILQTVCASIDQCSAMLIMSGFSLLIDLVPPETFASLGSTLGIEGLEAISTFSFGLFDYNLVRILSLVWFLVSKLSKSISVTYTVGVVLENLELYIGEIVNLVVTASILFANFAPDSTVQAAALLSTGTTTAVRYGLSAFVCFLILVNSFLIFTFIRCLFFFIDIVLIPICSFIPFASTVLEASKTVWVICLVAIAIINPYLFIMLSVLLFIISLILFKKIYATIKYFKKVYAKPFFKKFSGYDTEIPLICPKMPKKVKKFLDGTNITMVIPVFPVKKLLGQTIAKKHELWWFVATEDAKFICRPRFGKKDCKRIDIPNTAAKKLFIHKSLLYFEMFNLQGSEDTITQSFRRVKKGIHFVFSKEYTHRYDRIKELTGYTDFTEYKARMKEAEKQSKETAEKTE